MTAILKEEPPERAGSRAGQIRMGRPVTLFQLAVAVGAVTEPVELPRQ